MRILSIFVFASILAGMVYAVPEERYLREGSKKDDEKLSASESKGFEQHEEEESTLDDDDYYEEAYRNDHDDDNDDGTKFHSESYHQVAGDLYAFMVDAARQIDIIKTPEDVSAIAELRGLLHDLRLAILGREDYSLRLIKSYLAAMKADLDPRATVESLEELKRLWGHMKKLLESAIEYGG